MEFSKKSIQDFKHLKPRYSVKDGMTILDCGRARLYQYINDGLLEAYKVGGRTYLTPQGIDRVIEHDYKEAQK